MHELPRLPVPATLVLAAAVVVLLASAGLAQEAPPAETTAASPLSRAGQAAFERLEAGDAAGALAILEPLAQSEHLGVPDRALLGTLYLEVGRPADALATLRPLTESDPADPAVLYAAGRAAVAVGELDAAETFLGRSLAIVPRSPALRELGLLRGRQGRSAVAYRLLRQWIGFDPGDVEARGAAAALALKLERPQEAALLLDGLAPATPELALLHGQLRLQTGDPQGALELLEPLAAQHPPEMAADVHRLAADALIQAGRSADAVALLRDGAPQGPRLTLLLAEAQHRSGDAAGAVATLRPLAEPLLATGKSGEEAYAVALAYGRVLVAVGRGEAAIPFLELATEIDPASAVAWKGLADALLSAGRRDDARVALDRFRELSGDDEERRRREMLLRADPVVRAIYEAEAAMARGDGDEALGLLRRESTLSPDDLRLRVVELRYLLALGRAEEARNMVAAVAARHPESADAAYMRAVLHLAGGRRPEAAAGLRQALALDPGHVAALNDLAVLELAAGNRDEARRLAQAVLELHPEDAAAKATLARIDGDAGR